MRSCLPRTRRALVLRLSGKRIRCLPSINEFLPSIQIGSPTHLQVLSARSRAIQSADAAFSKFIRRRGSDKWGHNTCCTCGLRRRWEELTCGHFMPRSNLSTRWDEQNCAPQCYDCQGRNNGERLKFAEWIDKTYGPGTAGQLRTKSIQPMPSFPLSKIKEIGKLYRQQNQT